MASKVADLLDGLDLFKGFVYAELEVLGRYLTLEEVDEDKVIFKEGDPGNYMMILTEGRVAIYKDTEHGEQLLLREIEGRVIGEMALLDHERRSATCVAETYCEMLVFTQTNLARLAHDHPAIAYHFMCSLGRLLSKRLRRTSGIMADYLGH